MPRRFQLQPLLELSQHRSDAATRKLHALKKKWQEAQHKLDQLGQYRADYQARLQRALQDGMDAAQWRDYRLFLKKIELAVEQQGGEVERCKKAWEAGHREWLEHRRNQKVFDTLAQRHLRSEAKRETRLEQREQDEFAARAHEKPKD